MFDNLMQNLFLNAKNQVEEQKKHFEDKFIDFISSNQKIKIKLNANGKVLDIQIAPELIDEGIEAVEDLLVVNLNKALEKAEKYRNEELEKLKTDVMPNINDIFSAFDDEE